MDKSENQPVIEHGENQGKAELTIKEVSNILEETPNIVRNWLKVLKDHIPLEKNAAGYNVFDDDALERLKLIKQLHRERNYSIKQIQHYFATGGESYKPAPTKGVDELLAEELRLIREEMQQLREDNKRQQEFNQELVKRLDQQSDYIKTSLNKRDEQLMQTIRSIQETKQLIAAAAAAEQEKEQEKPKGFWSRLFGK